MDVVERRLDTSGTVCPMPAFKTRKEVLQLEPGEMLVITGDFPPAVENVIRIAEQNGCTIVSSVVEDGTFAIIVAKQ